uniref:Putative ovule protein n=1 Tax=Solanum chacoense TaxID=4108 RepID=A0A0V0I2F9_SOLCH
MSAVRLMTITGLKTNLNQQHVSSEIPFQPHNEKILSLYINYFSHEQQNRKTKKLKLVSLR